MGQNRILPIVAGLVLVMLLFMGMKSCSHDQQDSSQLTTVPIPGVPDADSPADTIRTLTAEVAAIKSESDKLSQQNEALLRQRDEIESRVKSELQHDFRQLYVDNESSSVNGLTQQLDFFKARLDELTQVQNQLPQNLGDIPVGFGLSGQEGISTRTSEIVWVEPLGAHRDASGTVAYLTPSTDSTSGGLLEQGDHLTHTTEQYLQKTVLEHQQDTPAYTVPRNSTLIGSTGMTALMGRIPKDGTVEDPFPFKVIVGKENLAANGLQIPGLDGMIFSGKASGDWTLSCVRGQLHSVTYVFADGTIRTLSSDDQNGLSQQGQSQQQERPLGWISDRRGIPCVTGVRISNSATYLSGRILASATEAAAGAFSQGEVTNSVSALSGVSTSVITGDAAKYAGGQALAGGASEISTYLRERAAQSFDVIYVDTGVELAIHIDIELPIDYQHKGRKTRYVYQENDEYSDLD